MAGIVRDPAAKCREQMTPEYGSDARSNDVQLQYAQHSRSIDFRLRIRIRRSSSAGDVPGQIPKTTTVGHIAELDSSADGRRRQQVQPVVPIIHLTIVNLVVRVDT